MRNLARVLLVVLFAAALLGPLVWSRSYEEQHREAAGEGPSRRHPLGTDELGRDRLARLLYGSAVSLSLAPCAALFSTLIAAAAGAAAGWRGGWVERAFNLTADLFLSLPWLFLLLSVRALLPLDTSPGASLAILFVLLSLLGWAAPSRVFRACALEVRRSDFLIQAKALGVSRGRLLWKHVLPGLIPVAEAQLVIAVPLFVLSEANLSLLGLGVAEPLPSLGGLLAELDDYAAIPSRPWVLAPAAVLILVSLCFHAGFRQEEEDR
jgi:peptide/nickel transport system permease protein